MRASGTAVFSDEDVLVVAIDSDSPPRPPRSPGTSRKPPTPEGLGGWDPRPRTTVDRMTAGASSRWCGAAAPWACSDVPARKRPSRPKIEPRSRRWCGVPTLERDSILLESEARTRQTLARVLTVSDAARWSGSTPRGRAPFALAADPGGRQHGQRVALGARRGRAGRSARPTGWSGSPRTVDPLGRASRGTSRQTAGGGR